MTGVDGIDLSVNLSKGMTIDLEHLPTKPGCYIYFDSGKKIIYIGKARNLKKRVSSYFQKDLANHDEKTAALVQQIATMDYIITNTEVEALLLESRLIKQHKPKYNIDLKENERYAYIKITNEPLPRLLTARKKEVGGNVRIEERSDGRSDGVKYGNDGGEKFGDGRAKRNVGIGADGKYFGPFVDGYSRALTVKILNESFQLRTCKVLPNKVCLNYHLGLCTGPCEGKVTREQYLQQVERAQKFLHGGAALIGLKQSLAIEMKQFAGKQQFEIARLRRDQLRALDILDDKQKVELQKEFDQDIIGYSTNGVVVNYFVFNIERGTINRKDGFSVTIPEHGSLTRTNEEFLMQYYSARMPPKEIVMRADFVSDEEYPLVCDALSKGLPYRVLLTVPQQGDKMRLLELATTNADYALAGESPVLIKLKDRLKLPTIPYDIECYDISNLGNDYIVAAKVHFTNGQPNKELYRRFRIKWTRGQQNDFAAMYEVIKRRFYRIKMNMGTTQAEKMPDLVVIDGGKGQLGAALDALRELELRVPIISLAKKEEEIYFPGLSKPLKTNRNAARDADIRLLQRIRDETHRFVITYHRLLRDTKSFDDLDRGLSDK